MPVQLSSTRSLVPFADMVKHRREEAKRSLLIQVRSKNSVDDLFNYCSQELGPVKQLHWHVNVKANSGVRDI